MATFGNEYVWGDDFTTEMTARLRSFAERENDPKWLYCAELVLNQNGERGVWKSGEAEIVGEPHVLFAFRKTRPMAALVTGLVNFATEHPSTKQIRQRGTVMGLEKVIVAGGFQALFSPLRNVLVEKAVQDASQKHFFLHLPKNEATLPRDSVKSIVNEMRFPGNRVLKAMPKQLQAFKVGTAVGWKKMEEWHAQRHGDTFRGARKAAHIHSVKERRHI